MKITHRFRLHARIQNTLLLLFLFLITGLLAWLSTRYNYQIDLTVNNRYTLSQPSQQLLAQLSEPLTITAYTSNNTLLYSAIEKLVLRYQTYKHDIQLNFVDPFTNPTQTREDNIQIDGELLITYQHRSEHVQELSEQAVSTALQRLVRQESHQIVFLQGHGERNPVEFQNPQQVGLWSQNLIGQGFDVQTINLSSNKKISDNVSLLIIASPQVTLAPEEVTILLEYVKQGGNLLWLLEPDKDLHGLAPLAVELGISVQPGTIIDPLSSYPSITSITEYEDHPITQGITYLNTFFPEAAGLVCDAKAPWHATALINTNEKTWSETGEVKGTIAFEQGQDIAGPLSLAFALDREIATTEKPRHTSQRVIVIGDGDFVSNAFLKYAGNLNLAMRLMNWLVSDEQLINIPVITNIDADLQLTDSLAYLIGALFLFALPIGLISTGVYVWAYRRKA